MATDAVMQAVLNDKFTSVVIVTVDTDAFINPEAIFLVSLGTSSFPSRDEV